MDEFQDYGARDRNIGELQQKVRKQNVSLNFATHKVENFDPPVLSALRQFGIQISGHHQPRWNVFIPSMPRDADPIVIEVPKFSFEDGPFMSDEEWDAVLADMRARYANPSTSSLRAVSPARAEDSYDRP